MACSPLPLKISLSAETALGAVIADMPAPLSVPSTRDVGSAWAGQSITGTIAASINVPKGTNRRIVVWGVAQTCVDPQLTYPVYGVADIASLTGGLLQSFSAYAMGPLQMHPTSNMIALIGTRFVELSLDGAGALGRWIAIFDMGANAYLTAEPVASAFALPAPPFIDNAHTPGYIRPLQPNRRYRFEFYNEAGALQSRHCHRTQLYESSGPQQESVTFSAATGC